MALGQIYGCAPGRSMNCFAANHSFGHSALIQGRSYTAVMVHINLYYTAADGTSAYSWRLRCCYGNENEAAEAGLGLVLCGMRKLASL